VFLLGLMGVVFVSAATEVTVPLWHFIQQYILMTGYNARHFLLFFGRWDKIGW